MIARHEIDIAAPLDKVWDLHTGVGTWPAWNREMTAAKLDRARRFEQTPDGVHVMTTESFAGDPVDTDKARMQAILDQSLTGWLGRLKQKAESAKD